jgi:hypothetical protein
VDGKYRFCNWSGLRQRLQTRFVEEEYWANSECNEAFDYTWIRRPDEVQAYQNNGMVHGHCPTWIALKAKVFKDCLLFWDGKNFIEVERGSWLVMTQDQEVFHYTNEDFQNTYGRGLLNKGE